MLTEEPPPAYSKHPVRCPPPEWDFDSACDPNDDRDPPDEMIDLRVGYCVYHINTLFLFKNSVVFRKLYRMWRACAAQGEPLDVGQVQGITAAGIEALVVYLKQMQCNGFFMYPADWIYLLPTVCALRLQTVLPSITHQVFVKNDWFSDIKKLCLYEAYRFHIPRLFIESVMRALVARKTPLTAEEMSVVPAELVAEVVEMREEYVRRVSGMMWRTKWKKDRVAKRIVKELWVHGEDI
ncbi:hypothetical protein K488DRAFT_84788 [Vararia minispora EC-137]|uniref:Uncharacterized protein n=1 Tax=Vararia minispora EC-137 TaxID=1314806 RepID=A0ACB8QPM1_9AGAM|nr:hypothetical protein K488DRAFT_84788 [Vararia minispora EC-137]